jgi:hypothetical protein
VCVNYCVCLFFDLGGSISRNLREKGKYIHKKFSSDVMRPQNLLKAVLDVFCFSLYYKRRKKMMNVIYWRSLVWKKNPSNRMKSLPCPLWCQKCGKIKVLKKEPLRSKLNKKITEFSPSPRLTTTTITHNFKINEF